MERKNLIISNVFRNNARQLSTFIFFQDYIRSHLINLHVYHGVLFGSEAEKLLTWDRAYLVRRAITKPNKFLCISVNWKNKIFHYQLDFNEDGWCCKKVLFNKYPSFLC